MFAAFDQAIECFLNLDLVVLADLGQGFVKLIGAGLAAADVESREEGAAGAGVLSQELFHGEVPGEVGGHGGKMAENRDGERGDLGLSKRTLV